MCLFDPPSFSSPVPILHGVRVAQAGRSHTLSLLIPPFSFSLCCWLLSKSSLCCWISNKSFSLCCWILNKSSLCCWLLNKSFSLCCWLLNKSFSHCCWILSKSSLSCWILNKSSLCCWLLKKCSTASTREIFLSRNGGGERSTERQDEEVHHVCTTQVSYEKKHTCSVV